MTRTNKCANHPTGWRKRELAQMADHTHGEMDIKTQEKTFAGFMKFTTWSVIAILAVIILMAVFFT